MTHADNASTIPSLWAWSARKHGRDPFATLGVLTALFFHARYSSHIRKMQGEARPFTGWWRQLGISDADYFANVVRCAPWAVGV